MQSSYPADVHFRVGSNREFAAECTDLTCAAATALTEPVVVYGTVLIALVVALAFAYVEDARECCRRERRQVAAERDALAAFARRIADMDPAPMTDGGVTRDVRVPRKHGNDGDLAAVERAYRETVMAVPHYEEEYGDSYLESLSEEFGSDAAVAVRTADRLTPALKRALIERSRSARSARAGLADAVAAEEEAVEEAAERLEGVDRERGVLVSHLESDRAGFDACADVWNRLGDLESACDEGVADRQSDLRDPPMHDGSASFYGYLYAPIESTSYPVLAEWTRLADRIRDDRKRVERRLSRML